MTIPLNKTVFFILLILLLLVVGISGVYGGYTIVGDLGKVAIAGQSPGPSLLNGMLLLFGVGLVPMVAAAWLITRLCFLIWLNQKQLSHTVTI